jgi:aspartyl aminopeptidase
MVERDFLSAELEVVPAFKASSVGFDSAFVGGYGQDDRVCAYTALKAICDIGLCKKTAVCVLADKEEVGSMGNTGMESRAFEFFLAELMQLRGEYDELALKRTLSRSKMLSADVDAGYDPTYPSVMEKNNSCYLGEGVCVAKYSGHAGKAGGNDASAEFVGEVRKLFEENDIAWQMGELGKVDQGGGGTIAYYLADQGLDVIDCGVAVLSMHAPFEITSKADIYMAFRAYNVFMK